MGLKEGVQGSLEVGGGELFFIHVTVFLIVSIRLPVALS